MVSSSLPVNAWTYIVFTVSFNLHGGGDQADFPDQRIINHGTADEPSDEPIRTGYTFIGWFTEAAGGTEFDFNTAIAQNTVIHARWERNEYTVSFNLHGGEDQADFPNQTVLFGDTAYEPSTEPTRTGYTFVGWFTAATGGTEFDFDIEIMEDTVIHAQWRLNEYNVSFNLHGGGDQADFPNQTVLVGDTADEPSTEPTRIGHTFIGWFTEAEDVTEFDFDTEIMEDTVIHAQWRLNEYNVSFNRMAAGIK